MISLVLLDGKYWNFQDKAEKNFQKALDDSTNKVVGGWLEFDDDNGVHWIVPHTAISYIRKP